MFYKRISDMTRERVRIEGMGCDHCVAAVRSALEQLDGVEIHDVGIGHADISVDGTVDRKQIDAAISKAGYQAVEHQEAA